LVYTKKAGYNVAVPLVKALVLPSIPNKQHWSPRRMYIYTKNVYENTHYGRLVSHCFGIYEFTRFWQAKTKRVRRFLSICQRNTLRFGWSVIYGRFLF